MRELTVLCWLWKQPGGATEYLPSHVNVWAASVRRNLSLPHRIACVTDMPEGLDPGIAVIAPPRDFDDVRVAGWGPQKPQCYRRLAMFRRDAAETFGERFVCMDVDCAIAGPLDPLFERTESLVIARGTSPKRPYNGSLMLIEAGCRPQVHERFTPEGAAAARERFLGSDQAWLSHVLGWGEATFDEDDGVHFWRSGFRHDRHDPRVLFFPGPLKPWHLAGGDRFVDRHWRR